MKKSLRITALFLGAIMAAGGLSSCSSVGGNDATTGETSAAISDNGNTPINNSAYNTPLVVAYDPFSGKFSPFYADTAYDMDVVSMTSVSPLTTDRAGGIIYNAIEGETVSYNGTDYTYKGIADITVNRDETANTTTYTMKLKEGVKFSDGEELTADDVIFTYYVLCDTSYVGSTTLSSYGIQGLSNYRTQTSDAVYAKYNDIFDTVYGGGTAGTDEQSADVAAQIKQAWIDDCGSIVSYVMSKYCNDDYASQYLGGRTAADISASADLQVAFGMAMWGYGSVGDDGVLTAPSGATWDLTTTFPTLEDYYNETYAAYDGDPAAYWSSEAADSDSVLDAAKSAFIMKWGPLDTDMSGGVKSISGITRVDDYTISVVTDGFEAPAIYSICGITIAPMHYYGDKTLYNYEEGSYGFTRGDLSAVEAKTSNPLGAGPYKFVKYENKVVYFEANENYYKGSPKTKYVQFKETGESDKISAITTGTADVSNPSGSKTKFEEIRSYNSNGELTGETITTSQVDNLGYGYIGLNADTVNVGGNPSSAESKNLRKALTTILSVYRDVSIDSYYGDAASVINYPISNTSWAAPQKSDADYRVAYSVNADGSNIYTDAMSADEKYAAALEASKNFFIAAGFTFDDATGKFTAAPEGAKLEYEVLIPGDGSGDHPSMAILSNAREALATIGINLIINDLSDSSVLWDRLDAGTQELWAAAWGATIDPDMYQVYHSSGIVGRGGSDSNHYHIDDAELDKNIMSARESADQSYRKTAYKACLDIILDWAVEIPTYQRQNMITFSTERVKMDTVTPDITTYWGWMAEIETIEMQSR